MKINHEITIKLDADEVRRIVEKFCEELVTPPCPGKFSARADYGYLPGMIIKFFPEMDIDPDLAPQAPPEPTVATNGD